LGKEKARDPGQGVKVARRTRERTSRYARQSCCHVDGAGEDSEKFAGSESVWTALVKLL
jgi:hypothetical protein